MMCAVVSVEFAIAVGFADACGSPTETVVRVMRSVEGGDHDVPRPNDLFVTNLTSHYLQNCSTPNPAVFNLDSMRREAAAVAAALQGAPAVWQRKCGTDALHETISLLDAAASGAMAPAGGDSACGGRGPVADLFADRISPSLCDEVALGFVQLFVFQAAAGSVLLLLSLLTPWLWHSHHLPPPTTPTRVGMRRALTPSSPSFFLRGCLPLHTCAALLRAVRAPLQRSSRYRRQHDMPADTTAPILPLAEAQESADVRTPMLPAEVGRETAAAGMAEGGAVPIQTPSPPTEAAVAAIEPLIARVEMQNAECSSRCSSHEAL